ncbi:MAG: addiction module protein [Phormidesmis sp.]
MSIDQLTQEALSLPDDLRLQLVEKLLSSLEADVDEAVQSEWLSKAKNRLDDIRSGLVQPVSGEEALAQVRQILT